MKTVFIYALKEPDTGEIRYIGKSNDPAYRLQKHLLRAKQKANHRECWLFSLLEKGLKPDLEILDEVPFEHWQQLEVAYIEFFQGQGCNLVNGTPGGDDPPSWAGKRHTKEWILRMTGQNNPNFGKKHSEQTKQRMKGRVFSEETRKKMSQAAKERPPISEDTRAKFRAREVSAETRTKLSAAGKGHEVSQETRNKIIVTTTGRKKTAAQVEAMRQGRLAAGDEKFQKILQLQAEGNSLTAIGIFFGNSCSSICNFLSRRRVS